MQSVFEISDDVGLPSECLLRLSSRDTLVGSTSSYSAIYFIVRPSITPFSISLRSSSVKCSKCFAVAIISPPS